MLLQPHTALPSTPTPLHDVIQHILHTLSGETHGTVDQAAWQAVAGAALAAHSSPASFRNGQLTVHVDRPGHLFLLHLKHRELLQRLQQHAGPGAVQALRFRLGART